MNICIYICTYLHMKKNYSFPSTQIALISDGFASFLGTWSFLYYYICIAWESSLNMSCRVDLLGIGTLIFLHLKITLFKLTVQGCFWWTQNSELTVCFWLTWFSSINLKMFPYSLQFYGETSVTDWNFVSSRIICWFFFVALKMYSLSLIFIISLHSFSLWAYFIFKTNIHQAFYICKWMSVFDLGKS